MVHITLDTSRIGSLLMGLVLWLNPAIAVQADNDYLSILEAEAADTAANSHPVASQDNTYTRNSMPGDLKASKLIEPGLSFEAFEETLNSRYSGSNSLYVKLSDKKRKRVYTLYQSDNRISSVREEIVRLLSSG